MTNPTTARLLAGSQSAPNVSTVEKIGNVPHEEQSGENGYGNDQKNFHGSPLC